jgi:hypothetical protein
MIFYYLLLLVFLLNVSSYLTSYQWIKINNILTNPKHFTISQKEYVNTLIYNNYQIWAFNQCLKLKQFHKYKCQHISNNEIKLYAQIGLYNAIINYNPLRLKNISFASYAFIYIRSEFYKCITELYPITSVSKYERRKGHFSRQNKTRNEISSFSPIHQEICFNDYSVKQYNKQNQNQFMNYDDLWLKIKYDLPISHMAKKIIKLKYSYEFKQQRSNKHISLIIGYSEETIRQYILEFKHEFNKQIF